MAKINSKTQGRFMGTDKLNHKKMDGIFDLNSGNHQGMVHQNKSEMLIFVKTSYVIAKYTIIITSTDQQHE